MGFMASWNTSATNSPILAEIVPPRLRTSVYVLDRMIEAVLASFARPMVGMLAERLDLAGWSRRALAGWSPRDPATGGGGESSRAAT
ncbi:hypothetical protein D1007_33589 [Hordeum vulgare]|nr:hypothetical protein D1007_33589 [Hordeum vulgare]